MPLSPVPCPDGAEHEASQSHDGADPGGGPSVTGRHRRHRYPARPHALKVLYGDEEHAKIVHAAEIADLRPSSYVAAAALAMAEQVHSQAHAAADQASSAGERRRHATLTPHHDRNCSPSSSRRGWRCAGTAPTSIRSPPRSTAAG